MALSYEIKNLSSLIPTIESPSLSRNIQKNKKHFSYSVFHMYMHIKCHISNFVIKSGPFVTKPNFNIIVFTWAYLKLK